MSVRMATMTSVRAGRPTARKRLILAGRSGKGNNAVPARIGDGYTAAMPLLGFSDMMRNHRRGTIYADWAPGS